MFSRAGVGGGGETERETAGCLFFYFLFDSLDDKAILKWSLLF